MKDEQIAREFLSLSCGDDICGVMDRKSCKCFREIVDALATARRAGFDAAKEQAAEVAMTEFGNYRERCCGSMECEGGHFDLEEIAAAIRAMEVKS